MNILAVNCGSSTLKFRLVEIDEGPIASGQERSLAHGVVEEIGRSGVVYFTIEDGEPTTEAAAMANHAQAMRKVLDWLGSLDVVQTNGLGAVGHRVVHGGDLFMEPTLIDDRVIQSLEGLSNLAPLHNVPSLRAISEARSVLGQAVPMVAVFDTAFHSTLPAQASHYAISLELAEKHRIRRYGFHGIAHRYMTERYATLISSPVEQVRLITLQLGNGCSAAAVDRGKSVDTSMGFTHLEGLMMGTRCGDIDPSVVGFLARNEGADIKDVESWLSSRSGLLGVSGISRDMRQVLEQERAGDARAALAVNMFCYRVRKQIGAYMAVLGDTGAVVFGGGIGENVPTVRERICTGMAWCGLALDRERNSTVTGSEARISNDASKIDVYVVPVDESIIIAHDTMHCLRQQGL